jgi:hypothetical protein
MWIIALVVAELVTPPYPERLSANQRELLGALSEVVIDPRGSELVMAEWAYPGGESANDYPRTRVGWRIGHRVLFVDGLPLQIPPAATYSKLDFVRLCRQRYEVWQESFLGPPIVVDLERNELANAIGVLRSDELDLVFAVWLWRLKEERLAVRALMNGDARDHGNGGHAKTKNIRDPLRQLLAGRVFDSMVYWFAVADDARVVELGEHLQRRYPDIARERNGGEAGRILADLARRKAEGRFGKSPERTLPAGFEDWDTDRKADYWIARLDEIENPETRVAHDPAFEGRGRGGELSLPVRSLVALGDDAVPKLVAVLENDRRLTRHGPGEGSYGHRNESFLSVRHFAFEAIKQILKTPIYDVWSERDQHQPDELPRESKEADDERWRRIAKCLRAYWRQFGANPFDERMMRILGDQSVSWIARLDAASRLAAIGRVDDDDATPLTPSPRIARFKNPTTAEAMLTAIEDLRTRHQDGAIRTYLEVRLLKTLVRLGDGRIAGRLVEWARRADLLSARTRYAMAGWRLGDARALTELARDFAAGRLTFGEGAGMSPAELLGQMVVAGHPECEAALAAVADPQHPQCVELRHAALKQLGTGRPHRDAPSHISGPLRWLRHPITIALLRPCLDDQTSTGLTLQVKKGLVVESQGEVRAQYPLPPWLAKAEDRWDETSMRVCDRAAEILSVMVWGVPPYSPLSRDCDRQRAELAEYLDRHRFRPTGYALMDDDDHPEMTSILYRQQAPFEPMLAPLDRPATPADVAAGRAIFHQSGRGRVLPLNGPLFVRLKGADEEDESSLLAVVQAELTPAGSAVYGVILRDGLAMIREDEIGQFIQQAPVAGESKKRP